MQAPDQAAIDRLLNGVAIPPCPAILARLQRELADPDGSIGRLGELIEADVGLAAAVLKVANSPAFGLSRKVGSVRQALPVLGMRTLGGLASGIVLKAALSAGEGASLERFWDTTSRVALLCGRLAQQYGGIPVEAAYTFGLFHDCGIALLIRRFPDYRDTLALANADASRSFTEIEDARHATNHAAIGYLLTRAWGLPEALSSATLVHHDFSIFEPDADPTAAQARTRVALATLAEHFVDRYEQRGDVANWIRGRDAVLAHLGLNDEDLADLADMSVELLNRSA